MRHLLHVWVRASILSSEEVVKRTKHGRLVRNVWTDKCAICGKTEEHTDWSPHWVLGDDDK